jgi:hypothetical protein
MNTDNTPIDETNAAKAINCILAVLNEAVTADAVAMRNLAEMRVSCNNALADLKDVRVQGAVPGQPTSIPLIGMTGLVGGIVTRLRSGYRLMGIYDNDGHLQKYTVVHWDTFMLEAAERKAAKAAAKENK